MSIQTQEENIFSWIRLRNEWRLWCCSCHNFKSEDNIIINIIKFNNKKCDSCHIRENYDEYFGLIDKLVSTDIARYIISFLT